MELQFRPDYGHPDGARFHPFEQ
ncbi:MAG: hypothetical protein K0Q72_4447, partial [Armatimonadetes bacterium]|nr:hypothetical protein [Armatimonadota bacterium]